MRKKPLTLKNLRSAIGLTQEELANAAGVKRRAVIRWEQGGNIKPSRFAIVAKAYQCTVQELQAYHANTKRIAKRKKRELDRVKKKLKIAC